MKVGLSTYSLSKSIRAGKMDVLAAVRWIAENGGEFVELSPSGYDLTDNPHLAEAIVKEASTCGMDIASYTIGANFIQETEDSYEKEIERVIAQVDIGGALGVKRMRHDAGNRPISESTIENLEKDLPKLADACRRIADHAKQYGITTSVENHGYHMQGSERVQRLVLAVDRDNFRTTMDIGNFLCVDEDPVSAVKNNVSFASMIHFKDFYTRDESRGMGEEGWFQSSHGKCLRGAIVGHGDIDIPAVLKVIKDFGYDGYISIEFEGMEDCELGSRIGMANVKRIWNEL
ncbi:MAG: sugar phosphate isomerase/epimerase [Kiritimatiellaeota bacterium]|nr:sugar phosphate isomerase/epimerase [Kiritimatiellota bacterium]